MEKSFLPGGGWIGAKIYKRYMAYPESPQELADWARRADALWAESGSMADLAEADIAAMDG
ncbi:MAG: hypothetical protein LBG43_06830 [Treponema sp.]|jgi:hypothetical protein|nr:hypothetical protein [Treponema sp.]